MAGIFSSLVETTEDNSACCVTIACALLLLIVGLPADFVYCVTKSEVINV